MSDNPRQFSSLDNGDRGMGSSLTNRPAQAAPAVSPIDFAQYFAVEKRVADIQKQKGTYVEKTSETEIAYQAELKAASDKAFRDSVQQAKDAQELQTQRNTTRNLELQNLRSSSNTPHPFETESERATARRLMGLPPIDEPPATSAATANREPMPSTGSPPPTPSGTGARASSLVEPTAHPAPAILAEAIAPAAIGGILTALPRTLPQAAGRLAIPGIYGGIDLANRVIHGQPIAQAASGALAGTIGSTAGFIIGTATGIPFMGYVGAAIGGIAASAFSDWLFRDNIPTTDAKHAAALTPKYVPFSGGQSPGALYYVTIAYPGANGSLSFSRSIPILGIITAFSTYIDFQNVWNCVITYNNGTQQDTSRNGDGRYPTPYIYSIDRADGHIDYMPADAGIPVAPHESRPYYYPSSPANNDVIVPSGTPAAGVNKGKANYVPGSMPSNNTPNGGGAFPGHGGLAPTYLPNPAHIPSNGGGMLPDYAPQMTPPVFLEPQDVPISRLPSGGGVASHGTDSAVDSNLNTSTIKNGVVTNPVIENAKSVPVGFAPTSTPQTQKASPVPDAYSPVPKAQLQPQPKTTDKTSELIKQQKKDFDNQIGRLTAIATAIAALTPAIQGIPDAIANSPAVQAANRETTQGAVCEIAQPGGCLGNALDDAANNINQNNNQNTANLLDKINAGANAAQLALLELINTKLGDLLPGGLSGTFTRLWQTLQVDRILNILILITTFHNALMLSNNLAQTLFAAIDNISQAVGFKWKNEKGEESGFGSIVSEWTASFFKAIFGEENYTELVANYKKANRIYQATANIFNALQSIGYSILSALEVVGSYVALIGNALRKWGEVGETAYRWFNPQPNFHNKFFTTIEGVTNVVSQVDQVASEVVSVEQNIAQIGELKNELTKTLGEEDNSKQGVQPPEAVKVKASADSSKSVSATGLNIVDSDKEADE